MAFEPIRDSLLKLFRKEAKSLPLWFKGAHHEATYKELQAKVRVKNG